MMNFALVIPERTALVSPAQLVQLEQHIAEQIGTIDDLAVLEEARARAHALETYLRRREIRRPALGMQRRIEARIGQLLPDADEAERAGKPLTNELRVIERPSDRTDFRILSHAFNGCPLSDEEWQQSRRALVQLIRQRLRGAGHEAASAPRATTEVDKVEREMRIRKMAAQRYTSRQIAETLGMRIDTFGKLVRKLQIVIPADSVVSSRGMRRIDSNRILEQLTIDADHLLAGVELINYRALDQARILGWISSLKAATRALQQLTARLSKELTHEETC